MSIKKSIHGFVDAFRISPFLRLAASLLLALSLLRVRKPFLLKMTVRIVMRRR